MVDFPKPVLNFIQHDNWHTVKHHSVVVGLLMKEIDGFYVWYPPENRGGYEPFILRAIADKLDELNKDWKDQINKSLGG
jgi:heme/copper-type cytochrome/quinol oxidase subunit 1